MSVRVVGVAIVLAGLLGCSKSATGPSKPRIEGVWHASFGTLGSGLTPDTFTLVFAPDSGKEVAVLPSISYAGSAFDSTGFVTVPSGLPPIPAGTYKLGELEATDSITVFGGGIASNISHCGILGVYGVLNAAGDTLSGSALVLNSDFSECGTGTFGAVKAH